MILRGHVTTRSLPFRISVDGGSTVYTLPYLKDHLAPVHGSLKLVDGGVERRGGASGPLESLGDAEPLAVDAVQDARQRRRHLLRQHLRDGQGEKL